MLISPELAWISRDKQYDAYNALKINESLSLSLYLGLDKMKTGAISFNQLIWKRKNVNYMKKKYLLNQTFQIPIEESISANISDIYLLLLVKQNNPNGAKPVELKTAKKIINWFVPKPDTRHNLLHDEIRNVTKLTPIPYIYRT